MASDLRSRWDENADACGDSDREAGCRQIYAEGLPGMAAGLAGVMHLATFANPPVPATIALEIDSLVSVSELARWALEPGARRLIGESLLYYSDEDDDDCESYANYEFTRQMCDEELEPWLSFSDREAVRQQLYAERHYVTVRLAGVMHLASFADSRAPVAVALQLDSIGTALKLARWAIYHSHAALSLMAAADGAAIVDALCVFNALRRWTPREITWEGIQTSGWIGFARSAKRLDRALEVLEDRGWLIPIEAGLRPRRRRSTRYQVHHGITRPLVFKTLRAADHLGDVDSRYDSPAAGPAGEKGSDADVEHLRTGERSIE